LNWLETGWGAGWGRSGVAAMCRGKQVRRRCDVPGLECLETEHSIKNRWEKNMGEMG
jgi:hypothetical protein